MADKDVEFVTTRQFDSYGRRIEKRNLRRDGRSLSCPAILARANPFIVGFQSDGMFLRKGWREAMKEAKPWGASRGTSAVEALGEMLKLTDDCESSNTTKGVIALGDSVHDDAKPRAPQYALDVSGDTKFSVSNDWAIQIFSSYPEEETLVAEIGPLDKRTASEAFNQLSLVESEHEARLLFKGRDTKRKYPKLSEVEVETAQVRDETVRVFIERRRKADGF